MKFETRTREYKNSDAVTQMNAWEANGWIVSKLIRSKNEGFSLARELPTWTVIVVFMREKEEEEREGGW